MRTRYLFYFSSVVDRQVLTESSSSLFFDRFAALDVPRLRMAQGITVVHAVVTVLVYMANAVIGLPKDEVMTSSGMAGQGVEVGRVSLLTHCGGAEHVLGGPS